MAQHQTLGDNMPSIYIQSGINCQTTGLGDLGYFGLTSREAQARFDEHFDALKKGKHSNEYIQRYYDANGEAAVYTNVVIDCDEYYINTLEKAYIYKGNTNIKNNSEGWNKSAGGEGVKSYQIPYSFVKNDVVHQGNDLLQFLKIIKVGEPKDFVMLHDGRLKEFDGFELYNES
jgi:hypothetical protein